MLNFEDIEKIRFYHTVSNVFYMLAPIIGGISLIPAVIVDAKLDEILDDSRDETDVSEMT